MINIIPIANFPIIEERDNIGMIILKTLKECEIEYNDIFITWLKILIKFKSLFAQ